MLPKSYRRIAKYNEMKIPAFLPSFADELVDYDYFSKLPEKCTWRGKEIDPRVWLFLFTVEYYYGYFGQNAENIHNLEEGRRECQRRAKQLERAGNAIAYAKHTNNYIPLEEITDSYMETNMDIKNLDLISSSPKISQDRRILQTLIDRYGIQNSLDMIWESLIEDLEDAKTVGEKKQILDRVATFSVLSLKEYRLNKKSNKK